MGNAEMSEFKSEPDYESVANSTEFQELLSKRRKFIFPLTIFFLLFYFSLPLLTSYTTILNAPAIGDISWAWIYGLAQFVMTWVLCSMYVKKSASFDHEAKQIISDQLEEGGRVE
ncbi:DUF485 domain-containing protein [Virgibacillus sp. DJP39]|uniref:DUF485 domain-containing protein n=1 Tax=Virgibacillus sp. DJP39 TaxID=3409790 RepID=UPI003BB60CCE